MVTSQNPLTNSVQVSLMGTRKKILVNYKKVILVKQKNSIRDKRFTPVLIYCLKHFVLFKMGFPMWVS